MPVLGLHLVHALSPSARALVFDVQRAARGDGSEKAAQNALVYGGSLATERASIAQQKAVLVSGLCGLMNRGPAPSLSQGSARMENEGRGKFHERVSTDGPPALSFSSCSLVTGQQRLCGGSDPQQRWRCVPMAGGEAAEGEHPKSRRACRETARLFRGSVHKPAIVFQGSYSVVATAVQISGAYRRSRCSAASCHACRYGDDG